jgi:predicted GNAT family N-acyltransferase
MQIRMEVFVDEQQVPPHLEPDEYDADALHLLTVVPETGEAVATARIVDKGQGLAKIGRVAVRKEWRGKHIGDSLMRFALETATASGFTMAALDAQTYVIPFYERLGFVAEGPVFDDAGIPHRHMRRTL